MERVRCSHYYYNISCRNRRSSYLNVEKPAISESGSWQKVGKKAREMAIYLQSAILQNRFQGHPEKTASVKESVREKTEVDGWDIEMCTLLKAAICTSVEVNKLVS